MRTVIYARYSSKLQNDRSVEDQVAACRERATREGWPIVAAFADRAISGAAGFARGQRPGLNDLLARVEAGGVDQVLVDTSSRLARDLGDADRLRKRFNFAGARLFTLGDGEIDAFKGAIKGLMDEQQRVENAHNIRRGQVGSIRAGRSSSGIAYGYRKVAMFDGRGEAVRGLREVDPNQAEIVRRCFREYVAGDSPIAIVRRLNAEGVPPPKRGTWRPSTLIGHRAIGFGVLANPIYIGRLVYGRSMAVVDPQTRERRSVRGTRGLHEGSAPHLRIIDDALWQAAQEQIERRATAHPERQRRPKRPLSGLGRCGACGANWIVRSGNWWGCSAVIAGGACGNHRLIRTEDYERRVLAGLKAEMLAPDVVAAYLREYHLQHARETTDLARDQARVARQLAEAERKMDRLVTVIAEGGREFAEVRALLTGARDDRDRLRAELAGMAALPVLTLHPGLADRYRREVETLEGALEDETRRLEAVPRLRELIAEIIVSPLEQGVDVRVTRRLDQALALAQTVKHAQLR